MKPAAAVLVFILLAAMAAPAAATSVTANDALTAAQAWVDLVTAKDGAWFGSKTAAVERVQELKRAGRVVGYFCPVSPGGYVILPLYRELAPVKAYSTTDNMDPKSDEGIADVVTESMERALDSLDRKFGRAQLDRPEGLAPTPRRDYRRAWDRLARSAESRAASEPEPSQTVSYEGGQVLLASEWNQIDPWNRQCPPGPTCAHSYVGCVATAASEIMHYWSWPPYGAGSPYGDNYYDWPNMLDVYRSPYLQAQVDAVAELCHEVGIAVDMDYGCPGVSGSSAYDSDMEDAYRDHFRYHSGVNILERSDRNDDEWFQEIRTQTGYNQPMQYGIYKHSIVCSGWKQVGDPPTRYIHIDYGWGEGNMNTWYEIDDPALTSVDDQEIIRDIRPGVSVYNSPSGTYGLDAGFPYRYFNMDAASASATFDAGQMVQFLPGVRARGTGTTSAGIRFNSSVSDQTLLYTRGDWSSGIKLTGGSLKLCNNGEMILRPLGPPRYVRCADYSVPPTDYGIWVCWERGYGGQDGFEIQRSVSLPGFWQSWRTVGPGENGLWDLGVLPGTTYHYRVRSFRGSGVSDWSADVSATTPS